MQRKIVQNISTDILHVREARALKQRMQHRGPLPWATGCIGLRGTYRENSKIR